MFKKSNQSKPAVRILSQKEIEQLKTPTKTPISNKKRSKYVREDKKQNVRNRKANKKEEDPDQIKELPQEIEATKAIIQQEKPIETITENLFEQYYYSTPFDRLDPEPKSGNIEYVVSSLNRIRYFQKLIKGKKNSATN